MKQLVIIGAGTAGITLARRVLENTGNVSIKLIDAGPEIKQGDYRTWLDFLAHGKQSDPYAEFKDPKLLDKGRVLTLSGSRYFGVGGSTNVWGGWCIRYQPEDFLLNTNTGEGADWPYSLSSFEPYYQRAEKTLWVAGEDKPNPPLPYTLKDGVIIDVFNKLYIGSYEHLPLARDAGCKTIGTCKYCPIRKRYIPQTDLEYIQKEYDARFELLPMRVARCLKMTSKKQCAGVRVLNKTTKAEETIEGDIVVIASGAIESPKLLLASTSSEWLNGVGNDTQNVGKHITAHPLVRVVGSKSGNPDNLEQPVDFPTLACRHYDTEEYQSDGKFFFVRDGRKNYTVMEDKILEGRSVPEIRSSMRDKMPFELRGFVEVFSHEDNFISLGEDDAFFGGKTTKVNFKKAEKTQAAIQWAEDRMIDILKEAGCEDAEGASFETIRADHATSTCRMGVDESNSVVDADLKVFGTDNLYVCSNAAIPNGAAVNPTLTLIALTEKLADHLVNGVAQSRGN